MFEKLRSLLNFRGEVLRHLDRGLPSFNTLLKRVDGFDLEGEIDNIVLRGLHDEELDQSLKLAKLEGLEPRAAAVSHAIRVFRGYILRDRLTEIPPQFARVLDQISFGRVELPDRWSERVRKVTSDDSSRYKHDRDRAQQLAVAKDWALAEFLSIRDSFFLSVPDSNIRLLWKNLNSDWHDSFELREATALTLSTIELGLWMLLSVEAIEKRDAHAGPYWVTQYRRKKTGPKGDRFLDWFSGLGR